MLSDEKLTLAIENMPEEHKEAWLTLLTTLSELGAIVRELAGMVPVEVCQSKCNYCGENHWEDEHDELCIWLRAQKFREGE